jgi:DNA-binding LytR/AlgR family response regulator
MKHTKHLHVGECFVAIGGRTKAKPNELLLLKANINYTQILKKDGKTLLVATPLKELEIRLKDYAFLRPNRSILINRSFIVDVFETETNNTFIQLADSTKVYVSRRRKTDFLKYFYAI